MREYFYNLATDKDKTFFSALIKFLLLLLSFVYGALIRGLVLFYALKPRCLKCKVISIGNITLGGTGKTSLTGFIAAYLKAEGRKVVILSRGYKGVSASQADEPSMLLKNLGNIPVIVGKDRVNNANRAIKEYGADTVIIDDGMQQWRIKKDLEIVAVSLTQGLGNRHMLPRGILREPLSSLKRADIFVLTKTNLAGDANNIKTTLNKINPRALMVESMHRALGFYDIKKPDKMLSLGYLKDKEVVLVSGIGDPDSFADLMRSLGVKVGMDLRFSDHHNYTPEDLEGIAVKAGRKNLGIIVTTEKDAVRLSDSRLKIFEAYQVLALRIALEITKNEKDFFVRLLSLYPL